MTTSDVIGIVISFVYAFGLIGVVETIRRLLKFPQDFTRKMVHIGAGMWVFGVLSLFDTWYIGIVPFATFIVLNAIVYRMKLLQAIDEHESSPGTIYFAISTTLLFAWFWRTNSPDDQSYIAVAGIMAMTWGDAMASIIGRRWGRHKYTVGKDTLSWEGSAAMFVASGSAMFLTLLLVPGSALSHLTTPLPLTTCVLVALAAAVVATIAEALGRNGLDNIVVPMSVAVMITTIMVWFG